MNKKHFIDEAVKFVHALLQNTKILCKIFWSRRMFLAKMLANCEEEEFLCSFTF